ncbi:hypothetical protein NEAUS05_2124 [Nematocida ausubeli]|nr:hypothetical protein NEAUS05_2124 [Nematocida ausubeli]
MECRRINTTVISFDYSNSDTLKRNQFLTVINCKLPGNQEDLSNIFRATNNNHFYYGAVTDRNTVIWFNVFSSASFLKEYTLSVTDKATNIAQIVNNPNDKIIRPIETEETEGSYPLTSKSKIIFTKKYIIIDTSSKIIIYDANGTYHSDIDMGLDSTSSMYAFLCSKYLFLHLEKGMICLYDINEKVFVYRKRHPIGTSSVFGNVFSYLRYFTISKNTLTLGRVRDGSILLELTYPEELTTAATDILHKKIAVGSVSGCVYFTRLDGIPCEFSSVKVSDAKIQQCFFSNSGRHIFALVEGQIKVIDTKDGKVVKAILNESSQHMFTYTSSSNLHFQ